MNAVDKLRSFESFKTYTMSRLKRLVKLTLKEGSFDQFKVIFDYGKYVVSGSEGCFGVQLLQDDTNPNIAFTLSEWTDEKALNKYRSSEEFRNYWPKIKSMLADKTEVWNLYVKAEND